MSHAEFSLPVISNPDPHHKKPQKSSPFDYLPSEIKGASHDSNCNKKICKYRPGISSRGVELHNSKRLEYITQKLIDEQEKEISTLRKQFLLRMENPYISFPNDHLILMKSDKGYYLQNFNAKFPEYCSGLQNTTVLAGLYNKYHHAHPSPKLRPLTNHKNLPAVYHRLTTPKTVFHDDPPYNLKIPGRVADPDATDRLSLPKPTTAIEVFPEDVEKVMSTRKPPNPISRERILYLYKPKPLPVPPTFLELGGGQKQKLKV
ncbi:hypothetical protein HK098_004386 [Nowakowskiella sp. JEL0407]|nr:hypothetical protein HK098_004386 [Nowakowskiella sp. JEL0407]